MLLEGRKKCCLVLSVQALFSGWSFFFFSPPPSIYFPTKKKKKSSMNAKGENFTISLFIMLPFVFYSDGKVCNWSEYFQTIILRSNLQTVILAFHFLITQNWKIPITSLTEKPSYINNHRKILACHPFSEVFTIQEALSKKSKFHTVSNCKPIKKKKNNSLSSFILNWLYWTTPKGNPTGNSSFTSSICNIRS